MFSQSRIVAAVVFALLSVSTNGLGGKQGNAHVEDKNNNARSLLRSELSSLLALLRNEVDSNSGTDAAGETTSVMDSIQQMRDSDTRANSDSDGDERVNAILDLLTSNYNYEPPSPASSSSKSPKKGKGKGSHSYGKGRGKGKGGKGATKGSKSSKGKKSSKRSSSSSIEDNLQVVRVPDIQLSLVIPGGIQQSSNNPPTQADFSRLAEATILYFEEFLVGQLRTGVKLLDVAYSLGLIEFDGMDVVLVNFDFIEFTYSADSIDPPNASVSKVECSVDSWISEDLTNPSLCLLTTTGNILFVERFRYG